jgi:hypothetical protein
MSQTCPNCGFVNRATNRFCSNCGVTLVSAPTAGDAAPTATPASDTQPVTYKVQTWDAPDAVIETPAVVPPEADVPSPPAFLPYGGYTPPAAKSPVAPSPVSPARSEGGMYAPYSTDAARKLETQKSQRSWLVPSVAAAGLLLVVLLVVGGILWLAPKNAVSTKSTDGSSSQSVPTGANDEETIKNVIKQSNDEQILAWRTLDTEVLKGTRTGQVLSENIQAVQELQSKKMFAIPVNKSLEFGEVKVDGDKATAKTVEVWTVTFYAKDDGKVVLATGPDTLQETYYLVKQDGKWLVSSLDILKVDTGTPTGNDS